MDEIELRLIKYAIPLLQYFGDQPQPFLFNWAHPQQPKGIPQYLVGKDSKIDGKESKIDNRLQFHHGVPDCLLTLSSLLRSMIQTEWTRHVARIKQNDIETDKLHAFLFDRTRTDLNKTRVPLRELQQQLCFYCNEPLSGETGHVDHFIPWSRHPNDAIENLVVAHSACNISKSNFLVAPHHLERWKERLGSSAISRIAKEVKWPSERAASISIVQSMYGRLSSGVMVWSSKTKMVELGKDDAKDLLKQLDSLRNSAA
jgi:5-methylcytosine-specific restriction endonuclease McrA